jgi:glycosyltransferase involved in cell wall biosynthesis
MDIYADHDIFLFPSLFEGFGKTVLEAMACGMCVVGFAEGGLSDIATDGEDAMFCEAGDRATFREMLERCLSDPILTRAIGRKAAVVAKEYSWAKTAEQTERFCRELKAELSAR